MEVSTDSTTQPTTQQAAARTFSVVRFGAWSLLFAPLSLAGLWFVAQARTGPNPALAAPPSTTRAAASVAPAFFPPLEAVPLVSPPLPGGTVIPVSAVSEEAVVLPKTDAAAPGDFVVPALQQETVPAPSAQPAIPARLPAAVEHNDQPLLPPPAAANNAGQDVFALVNAVPPDEGVGRYVDGLVETDQALELTRGQARVLRLKRMPKSVRVAGGNVVDHCAVGSKAIALHGRTVGSAVLSIAFAGEEPPSPDVVLTYIVRVLPDPETRVQFVQAYKTLEAELRQTFPACQVELKFVGDAILVVGEAPNARTAEQIVQIVTANSPGRSRVVNMLRTESASPAGTQVLIVQ